MNLDKKQQSYTVLNIVLAIFGQQPTVNGKLVDRSAINHFTSPIKVPTVQVSILVSIFGLGSTVSVKNILACLQIFDLNHM